MHTPDGLRRRALCRTLLAALLLPLPVPRRAVARQTGLTAVDRSVPEFSLTDVQGEHWTSERLAGKPWIINFWATWCPPCIEEIPSMNIAWSQLAGEGIGMLAINAGEGLEAVKAFVEQVPIDFPVLLGDRARTLPDWSVRALPTTLIVDTQRRVVYEALGPREWHQANLLDPVKALRTGN